MSASVLRNNRLRCATTNFQCHNETINTDDNLCRTQASENEASSLTTTKENQTSNNKKKNMLFAKRTNAKRNWATTQETNSVVNFASGSSSVNSNLQQFKKRRVYSMSESEKYNIRQYQRSLSPTSSETYKKKYFDNRKRRQCRRSADSLDDKSQSVDCLHNAPQAPSNTTQFLITDREERESSDRDVVIDRNSVSRSTTPDASVNESNPSTSKRPRCYSIATSSNRPLSPLLCDKSSELSFDEDSIEDSEFAAVFDDFNFERIKKMSREEVNCEMLVTQKSNLHLNERVDFLKNENFRLKRLLNQHGIDYSEFVDSKGTNFSFKLPRTNSSQSSS